MPNFKTLEAGLSALTYSTISHERIEEDVFLCEIDNSSSEEEEVSVDVDKNLVGYYFLLGGALEFNSDLDPEGISIRPDNAVMTVYPVKKWHLNLAIAPGSSVRLLFLTLKKLHQLFGSLALENEEQLRDALQTYQVKTYYSYVDFRPSLRHVVNQLFRPSMQGTARKIFLRAKLLELLSLLIDNNENNSDGDENCPFITDNKDWDKIRKAKELLVRDLQEPPSIKELSRLVALNEFKLKTGFKHLHGNTIYGYLNEYRMELARSIFESSNAKVSEVSARVGYSNPSHFIAAFKKKFGITPKKFIQNGIVV